MTIAIWENETLTVLDPTAELIAISPDIPNNNNMNTARVVVTFHSFTPQPNDNMVKCVLEEEVAAGVWAPLADQFEFINSNDNAPTRIIEISPRIQLNPGLDEFKSVGAGVRISRTEGKATQKMRLAIYNTQRGTNFPLTDFTLSAYISLSSL